MTTFDVQWEVRKIAKNVEAKNEEEAIKKVLNNEVEGEEDEITLEPEAFEN
ncbi:MAG: hypothetical protein KGJ07_09615 [Patescibacteria group bacterium]|nr:hypothetical protein [Patescibacteria group bacterium]